MEAKFDEISANVVVLMEERVMYKQLLAQSLVAQSHAAPSPAAPPPFAPSPVAPSPAAPSPAAPSPGQDSVASTQDNAECELYLANPHRKVAVGMLCNQFSPTMHNLPMLENHLRVRVDYSIEGFAPLPVPIVNADIFTVGQALSTFVAWPAELVVVPQKSVSKARSRPSPSTENTKVSRSSPSKKGKEIQHVVKSPNNEFEQFIAYLKVHVTRKMKPGVDLIYLPTDEIVGVEQIVVLGVEDLKAVYDMEWATVTDIRVYIRSLYNEMLVPSQRTQKFLFLCPECLVVWDTDKATPEDIMARKKFIESYVLSRFRAAQHFDHESLFFAPLNIGQHWVLFAINPKRNTVYYLDSLQGHYKVYVDFVQIVDSALKQYWGYSVSKTKWVPITCPKQPNNNDCGYYTMRYMREIITHDQLVIPIKYFPELTHLKQYSDEQLTTVRGEWCRYVSRYL